MRKKWSETDLQRNKYKMKRREIWRKYKREMTIETKHNN